MRGRILVTAFVGWAVATAAMMLAALAMIGCTAGNESYVPTVERLAPVAVDAGPADLAEEDAAPPSCGHQLGEGCCFAPPNLLLCDRGMQCGVGRVCEALPDLAMVPDLVAPPDLWHGDACLPEGELCGSVLDCCQNGAVPISCFPSEGRCLRH